ncbi:MAG: hypothetical protein WDM76_00765 [Limisphaerales bacterium]
MVRYDGSVRLCGCRFKRTDMDDMVVWQHARPVAARNLKELQDLGDHQGFYSGQRPETCGGCSLYQPINRAWLQDRQQVSESRLKDQAANMRFSPVAPELTHTN